MRHVIEIMSVYVLAILYLLLIDSVFVGTKIIPNIELVIIVCAVIVGIILAGALIKFANKITDKSEKKLHGLQLYNNGGKTLTQAVLGDNKITIQSRYGTAANNVPCAGIYLFERTSENYKDNVETRGKDAVFLVSTTEEGFDVLIRAITSAKEEFMRIKNS